MELAYKHFHILTYVVNPLSHTHTQSSPIDTFCIDSQNYVYSPYQQMIIPQTPNQSDASYAKLIQRTRTNNHNTIKLKIQNRVPALKNQDYADILVC